MLQLVKISSPNAFGTIKNDFKHAIKTLFCNLITKKIILKIILTNKKKQLKLTYAIYLLNLLQIHLNA